MPADAKYKNNPKNKNNTTPAPKANRMQKNPLQPVENANSVEKSVENHFGNVEIFAENSKKFSSFIF